MKMTDRKNIGKITDALFLFFLGAGMGWIYEVIIHFYKDGMYVNRGMLHGP